MSDDGGDLTDTSFSCWIESHARTTPWSCWPDTEALATSWIHVFTTDTGWVWTEVRSRHVDTHRAWITWRSCGCRRILAFVYVWIHTDCQRQQ